MQTCNNNKCSFTIKHVECLNNSVENTCMCILCKNAYINITVCTRRADKFFSAMF